ncbi:hypothetical protein HNR19_003347 [Nocardioides thalensis]|uniref:WD40 repeat domain-containing protein n=1 Tax=Nocardioides thalensis TaxID=1914755 RepID=A0A853C5W0_9ACTN|nr:hypothetical protein [Nocardioides thalensis]NYJ02649.1 hypothetical protein [Nocardioides thalensis]
MNTDHQNPSGDRPESAGTDRAWESAMSRDFDARVRGLTEAPLSLDEVKGKAVRIRRNRRIAAAGGALAVAAAVTPIALVATSNGDADTDPPVATNTAEDTTATEPDYIVDNTWHQGDGDDVALPDGDYYSAATIWDGQLVVQRPQEQDVSNSVTEIFDADGDLVDSFSSNQGVAVGEDGTFFAYISDGVLTTRSEATGGGGVPIADGFDINHMPVAATGDAACGAASDACTVYVNDGDGPARVYGSDGSDEAAPEGALKVSDATGSSVSLTIEFHERVPESCGGVYDVARGEMAFDQCDYQAQQISPDGRYVAAVPSYTDGFGATTIYILDAESGEPAGQWAGEGASITSWEWTTDGRLMFVAYDGANWHLKVLPTYDDGRGLDDVLDPVRGSDLDNPYTLIQH